ncbi:putative urea transporter [Suillus clintonianus]|uniref:putative urea transporter n=1 Tax=Suillus clintonianus TaxID=1904413 RepID=UPI001B87302B|nr:putative urea transporter [Suillus clintonianus]KAG2141861.1 putative urea transporter [Suillus clintonianus]
MLCLTAVQSNFSRFTPSSSEEFTSASRSVKPGLVCCGIVSAWTWSATLLQSSTAAYTFGMDHSMWYGAGGSIQVAMFGMVAAKVKMNANGAHTFLEIVKVRFGTAAHIVFTIYAFICVLVVCGSLLVGGAATVNALTGMNTLAAYFLLPIGIAVYVVFGGLRATFICDWTHTIILFAIIYIFIFRAYGTSSEIGSVARMYELLTQAAIDVPVPGNANGSYMTMKSNQGLVFGASALLSGFAGVFCDQGTHPSGTTKAYMLGGLSWFAVPWAFGSCLGLSARALQTNPLFPTYPFPLSPQQTSAGLAAPAAAAVLMGKGGAVALLLVVFMAVTSAASAELIAVSSIVIYRTYWNPHATGAEIVRVSHYAIGAWAIWMGCWATIVNSFFRSLSEVNIDLGWVRTIPSIYHYSIGIKPNCPRCTMGIVLSPAVIPIILTVWWSKLTRTGLLCGSIMGAILGMLAWMIGCWKINGKGILGSITIANLALPISAVCSGLTGFMFSGLITVFVSLLKPDNYDFEGTRAIAMLDSPENSDPDSDVASAEKREKLTPDFEAGPSTTDQGAQEDPLDHETLQRVFRRAAWYSSAMSAIVILIVPLSMFFTNYVFSERFYTFWVTCSIVWVFLSGTFSVVLPVLESWREMAAILKRLGGLVSTKLYIKS